MHLISSTTVLAAELEQDVHRTLIAPLSLPGAEVSYLYSVVFDMLKPVGLDRCSPSRI